MDAHSFFAVVTSGDEDAVRDALAADRSLARAVADPAWARRGFRAWTALHEAISAGHEGIAARLIDAGADLDARNDEGRTALHDSIELGRVRTQEHLLQAGAHVDVCAAAILGRLDRLRELLDGDPALVDDGSTHLSPLGWASFGNRPEIVEELFRRGATLDADALLCAASCGHAEVAAALLAHGADPNRYSDSWGGTPLSVAASLRYTFDAARFVELLLESGADPGIPDEQGRTPLMVAVQGKEETSEPGRRFDAIIALLEGAAR